MDSVEQMKPDAALILAEAKRRGVTRLVHFTPSINLLSIVQAGFVLSRTQLKKMSVEVPDLHLDDFIETNDAKRLDQKLDHINLSIEMPNTFLLRRFMASPRYFDDWCILVVSADCLCFADTLFSVSNAASAASRRYGIRGDYEGFLRLFANDVTVGSAMSPIRKTRSGLRDCYPTDVQAEVLVPQRLPLGMVSRICFESDRAVTSAKHALRMSGLECPCPLVADASIFRGERV